MEKNGDKLSRRSKLTQSCRAEGKGRKERVIAFSYVNPV
jgi:hypothetical protein